MNSANGLQLHAASLCSGIGAPEAAMPGWGWRWCAEIDRQASAVHAARHGSPNLGDMNAPDFVGRAMAFGDLDVIVAGWPCQDLSIAGKRAGLAGERSGLFFRIMEIVSALAPAWIVLENVPGLLSMNNGADFTECLDLLNECGYIVDLDILDAQHFGVPQRRERVFLVCENLALGRQRRTPSYAAASLGCLIELCLSVLAEAIRPCGCGDFVSVPSGPDSADGAKRRMKFFGLPPVQRLDDHIAMHAWRKWLSDSDEKAASYLHRRVASELCSDTMNVESRNTEAEPSPASVKASACSSTSLSWNPFLVAVSRLASKSTILTETNETTHLETYTAARIVLHTCEYIARLIPCSQFYWSVGLSSLTALRRFISYANEADRDLFKQLHCGNDWFIYLEAAKDAELQLERHLGNAGSAGQILSQREGLFGHPPPSRETGQGVAAPLAAGTGGSGGGRGDPDTSEGLMIAGTFQQNSMSGRGTLGWNDGGGPLRPVKPQADHQFLVFGGNNTAGQIDVATDVNAHGGPHGRLDFESETFVVAPLAGTLNSSIGRGTGAAHEADFLVAHTLRGEGHDASEDGTGRGVPLVTVEGLNWQSGGSAGRLETGDRTSALSRSQTPAVMQPMTLEVRGREGESVLEWRQDGTANALRGSNGGRAGMGVGAFASGSTVRRLTPEECEALQGLPRGFTQAPWSGKPMADGPRYRMIGNSMAVPVIGWVLERVGAVHAALAEEADAA
jgi:DNA-cytosine methyltransferase